MSLIGRVTNLDRRKVKLSVYLIVAVFLMGSSGCIPQKVVSCGIAFKVYVPIGGTSEEFTNPCFDGFWHFADNFEIFDLPTGVTLNTADFPDDPRRTLSADTSVKANTAGFYVHFTYTDPQHDHGGSPRFGTGTMDIIPFLPLTVLATADPDTIAPGGKSQLSAIPTGGVPPYNYAWSPTDTLSKSVIQKPSATPGKLTIYTVTVTDSQGLRSSATVTVAVNASVMSLTIGASPPTINPGQTSQLNAAASGGARPYVYTWSPAASLSNPGILNPIATPAVTTMYQVTATDSLGAKVTGNVTVTVNAVASPMTLTVSATPAALKLVGQTSQLNVTVSGGAAPYKYAWSGQPGTLSATNIPNPIAAPTSTTIYSVVVTDANGATATGGVIVAFGSLN